MCFSWSVQGWQSQQVFLGRFGSCSKFHENQLHLIFFTKIFAIFGAFKKNNHVHIAIATDSEKKGTGFSSSTFALTDILRV